MRNSFPVVLASASPRRLELLLQIGITPEVVPSQVEEHITSTEPAQVVMELSGQKAGEVAARLNRSGTVVVGSDTVVSIDGRILGKPGSREEAFGMLTALQGRSHEVYTGVTLLLDGRMRQFSVCTRVDVYPMTAEEIHQYLDTGDSMDKAGAYGIQGQFAAHIRGIEGSYTNVMGLPVGRLYQEMKALFSQEEEHDA